MKTIALAGEGMEKIGFHQNKQQIEGFFAQCKKCESNNVEIQYEFNYYGGLTGWDSSLAVQCNDCDNRAELDT